MTLRAVLALLAAALAACGQGQSARIPSETAIGEPLAAVRTSELTAGPAAPPPELGNPYADAPDAMRQGRQLYEAFNCGGCHGGQGGGGIGPPLADDKWIYGGSDANIYTTVIQGRPNGMPAFARMTGEAGWRLAAYVRSLSGGGQESS